MHGKYSSVYTYSYLAVAATVLSRDRCMDGWDGEAGPGKRAASVATTARDKPLDVTRRRGTHGAVSATCSYTVYSAASTLVVAVCFLRSRRSSSGVKINENGHVAKLHHNMTSIRNKFQN